MMLSLFCLTRCSVTSSAFFNSFLCIVNGASNISVLHITATIYTSTEVVHAEFTLHNVYY